MSRGLNKAIENREHQSNYTRVVNPPQLGTAEEWLEPSFWQKQNAVVGQSKGRNVVWFVTDGAREFVLRHYYRGGLPGKLITDQFIYTGLENTRSMAEFNLLLHLADQGLPVPRPVAARVERRGLIYRASLLIERIAGARDIFQLVCAAPLPMKTWEHIGSMLAAFHHAGVYHSDLNCHNILWQDQNNIAKPWLIDFDRCELRRSGVWKAANIARLRRSFEKELRLQPSFYWQEGDWQALLKGYEQG